MPEITVIHIALITVMAVVGVIAGWILRGKRCVEEKEAVNAGWQEQIEAQRAESDRLVSQNKSLMEQVSQLQASSKDATNRAKELAASVKEAFARRDELQREIKEVRSSLESTLAERDKLQSNIQSRSTDDSSALEALSEKDEKIFKLSRELENWQDRLPPLIERFRVRNEEATQLEADLADAQERINALEKMVGSEHTRVEPVDADSLPDDMAASNDSVELPAVDAEDIETADVLIEAEELIEADDLESADDTDEADVVDVADDAEAYEEVAVIDDDAETHIEAATHNDVEQDRDDLKKIKGVGPAIEKTLNELGIFRFSQIADMNEYDIDRVAQRLKGFRSRIYREDWIGQARELQSGGAA